MGRGRLNGQSGSKINGIIEEYTVQAGENISAGDFIEFVRGMSFSSVNRFLTGISTASIMEATMLTESHVIVLYVTGSSQIPYLVVVGIENNSVSLLTQTPVRLGTALTSTRFHIERLSDTKAAIFFQETTPSNKYAVAEFTGTSILLGNAYLLSSAANFIPCENGNDGIIIINENKFISFYVEAGTSLKAVVFTVSGRTLSSGPVVTVYTNSGGMANKIDGRLLSDGTIVIGFNAYNYLYIQFLTISGTDIAFTPPVVVSEYTYSTLSRFCFISDKSVMGFHYYNGILTAVRIDITNKVVTVKENVKVPYSYTLYFWNPVRLSDSKILLGFSNVTSTPFYPAAIIINVGDGVKFETLYRTFSSMNALSIGKPVKIARKKFLMVFVDGNNAACAQIGTITEFAHKSENPEKINGVSKSSGVSGAIIKAVTCQGGL